MTTYEARAEAVLLEAWRRLPPLKRDAYITRIDLDDLGAKHGSYAPDTGVLTLSTRLFMGANAAQVMMIDVNGETPPLCEPCCSRALHTSIHECLHAIGTATGLDSSEPWLRLSGFELTAMESQGTQRYWESRPGWEPGPSPWRYREDAYMPRAYSGKSPQECFADCGTHVALGWTAGFDASANGRAKLAYMRREVWGERGMQAVQAAQQRWQGRLTAGARV